MGCRGLSFEHVQPPLVTINLPAAAASANVAVVAKADAASSPRSFAASFTPSSVRASIAKRLSKRAEEPPPPLLPVAVAASVRTADSVQSSVLTESAESEVRVCACVRVEYGYAPCDLYHFDARGFFNRAWTNASGDSWSIIG